MDIDGLGIDRQSDQKKKTANQFLIHTLPPESKRLNGGCFRYALSIQVRMIFMPIAKIIKLQHLMFIIMIDSAKKHFLLSLFHLPLLLINIFAFYNGRAEKNKINRTDPIKNPVSPGIICKKRISFSGNVFKSEVHSAIHRRWSQSCGTSGFNNVSRITEIPPIPVYFWSSLIGGVS